MKQKIENFLHNEIVEKSIIILILLNMLALTLSTIKSVYANYQPLFYWFEFFSIGVFTIEYFLRLSVCKSIKDMFKPMMIIDFLAIAPFYLSFVKINTIFLRIFRLSRILRLLKINRYNQVIENILNSFKEKKEEFIITLSIFVLCVFISGVLIYYAEHIAQPDVFSSIPKACYFAIITFTSVGYGDFIPLTEAGKIIASFMAITGVCIHGLLIGVIGAAIMKAFRL